MKDIMSLRTTLKYRLTSNTLISFVLIVIAACIGYLQNRMLGFIPSSPGGLNVFLYSVNFDRNFMHIVAPFIGTFACGKRMYDELRTGLGTHLVLRWGHRKYFWNRLLMIFIDAALIMALSLLIILLFSIIMCPNPSYRLQFVRMESAFSSVYEKSMILYIAIFILNTSLFSAIYAVFGCGLFLYLNNKYIGFVIPPVLYSVSTYIRGVQIKTVSLFPYNTLSLDLTNAGKLIQDHLLMSCVALLLCILGYRQWKRS